jgi:hypothetical protein
MKQARQNGNQFGVTKTMPWAINMDFEGFRFQKAQRPFAFDNQVKKPIIRFSHFYTLSCDVRATLLSRNIISSQTQSRNQPFAKSLVENITPQRQNGKASAPLLEVATARYINIIHERALIVSSEKEQR